MAYFARESRLEDYKSRTANEVSQRSLANITEFGQTPLFTLEELRAAGVAVALLPSQSSPPRVKIKPVGFLFGLLAAAGRVTGEASRDVNYIIPQFVLNQLPLGLAGLFIAAVIAAAMSAVPS